ncbi:Holliday junction branch migration protein RuvA [Sporichthya sp.]|uniref:Holliday junction branch migration protein RuvA n=1 Tax=Sporichthya sp. TaxID=65475 RepID=UPI0017955552|nr:Holliday junction branch migration protein RuvA [Sporichthya sp.]MBA3742938.1 Holliday junction branch migration protein RuvA [Sporichthya sp.]
MISFVAGRVAALGPDAAVVEVGGIGLSLTCTPNTLAGLRIGERAQLPATLIVREDSLTLFGFADEDERIVFEQLMSVSGVGPRLAQAMLAVHDPDELRRAVTTDDLNALMKVPGIGRKGAQRIALELKDRLGPPRGGTATIPAQSRPGEPPWRDQVHGALLNLGWSTREAEQALDVVQVEADATGIDTAEAQASQLLRMALKTLGRAT